MNLLYRNEICLKKHISLGCNVKTDYTLLLNFFLKIYTFSAFTRTSDTEQAETLDIIICFYIYR